jgi:hypothetical protein
LRRFNVSVDESGNTIITFHRNWGAPYNCDRATGIILPPSSRNKPIKYEKLTLSFQASPNPFVGKLNIDLIGLRGEIDVSIYNAAGRLIKRLWKGMGGDILKIHWDGRDDLGRTLPSGVYFVQLKSKDGRIIGKRRVIKLE